MSKLGIIINGLIKENPTFVLLLGMCPTLGTTSSAINGMSMGLATMAVLICSNFVISCLKNLIPDKVHIPCYIVVIAGFVTVVQLLLKAYAPAVDEKLGLGRRRRVGRDYRPLERYCPRHQVGQTADY